MLSPEESVYNVGKLLLENIKKTPRIPPRRIAINLQNFAFLNRCSLRWYEPNQVQRVSVYRTQSQLAITSPPTFFRYELFDDYYTHSFT